VNILEYVGLGAYRLRWSPRPGRDFLGRHGSLLVDLNH